MRASIVIVSKNRKTELERTIGIVLPLLDNKQDEFLIFLDGCTDDSQLLMRQYPNIQWTSVAKSVGASMARNILYKKIKGTYIIGLDDDAHPLQNNFIEVTENIFLKDRTIGVLAFQELRGTVNKQESIALAHKKAEYSFECSEFVGCGFALRSDVYFMTDGFPTWVDIYGEESCLSLEIISKGFKILWTNSIMVHHRVNKNVRANSGRNHFRFTKQLRNVSLFYVVYYKNPYAKLFKLYFHNFKKYAVKDIQYFKGFFSAMGRFIVSVPSVLKYRSPIDKKYIEQRNKLKNPGF